MRDGARRGGGDNRGTRRIATCRRVWNVLERYAAHPLRSGVASRQGLAALGMGVVVRVGPFGVSRDAESETFFGGSDEK